MPPPSIRATRLMFDDEALPPLRFAGREVALVRGIGSGLAQRPGDPTGRLWSVGDRGPNVKVAFAIKHFGLGHLAAVADVPGAKIMPCPEIGPAISELQLEGDRITCLRTFAVRDQAGRALSGLPVAEGMGEVAMDIAGRPIAPDLNGADSEAIVALADGTFWIGDEYGPSLLHVDADGTVLMRWVPAGDEAVFRDAAYPVRGALPAIAARRQFNRGFEALAVSADEAWLYLAFQSPLAHPDEDAHRHARHVRIWKLSATTGEVAGQYLYPLDKPSSFRRDKALGDVHRSDLKVSELTMVGADRLLVLERGSATSKFYTVQLEAPAIERAHLDVATRPTLEELSAAEEPVPELAKRLVFSTDDFPEIDPDLEGVAVLDRRTLLLVNDNDFGVDGVRTRFWRIELGEDI